MTLSHSGTLSIFLVCIAFVSGCGRQREERAAPKFTSCPGEVEVNAGPGTTTSQVTWSQPTASGGPYYKKPCWFCFSDECFPAGCNSTESIAQTRVVQVRGPQNGSTFQEGSTLIGYRVHQDSSQAVDICSFSANVQVKRCPALPKVAYGRLLCPDSYVGATCTYSCNSGYTLNGTGTLTCQPGLQWDNSPPSCQPVGCGPPEVNMQNGNINCTRGFTYTEKCVVSCDEGYRVSGPSSITCQATGQWTSDTSCVDYIKPDFPSGCADQSFTAGSLEAPVSLIGWPDPEVTDNSGLPVSLTYSPSIGTRRGPGHHVFNVTATDRAGNKETCSFAVTVIARTCQALTSPSNGKITCTRGYFEGSDCAVTCEPNYELQDQQVLTCLPTQLWSAALPTCVYGGCAPPPKPTLGSLECPNGYGYNTTCWLVCPPGFQTPAVHTVKCLDSRTWTTSDPCVDVQPPQFTHGCPDNVEMYNSGNGQPNLATWKDPVVTDNSPLSIRLHSNVTMSNYSFPVGVTTVMYTATDNAGNANTCTFTVSVKASVCPLPTFSPYMSYNCSNGYVYGANCSLSCPFVYPLLGSNKIQCMRDNTNYPPTFFWSGLGPGTAAPNCTVKTCPTLKSPAKGNLSCSLMNSGYKCEQKCDAGYDIPYGQTNDGNFYCFGSSTVWDPSNSVSDCLVSQTPTTVYVDSDLYYDASNCDISLNETMKQNFITRMTDNNVLRNACANVSCAPLLNVTVSCGQYTTRKKKSAVYPKLAEESSFKEHRRQKREIHYYYQISFRVVVTISPNAAVQQVSQSMMALSEVLVQDMTKFIARGTFNETGLDIYADPGDPVRTAVCPSGTKSQTVSSGTIFSCVGCGTGRFLNSASDTCIRCPVGSYVDVDNATSCMSCPVGWSTAGTGSRSSNDCLRLCSPGQVSPDGFVPCSPCPPGHYSTQTGARSCSVCPANTWTDRDGVNSSDLCIDSDLVLSNTSVVVKFQLPTVDWVIASFWVSMPSNSSLLVRVGGYAEVNVQTSDFSGTRASNNSGIPTETKEVPPLERSRINVLLVPQGFSFSGRPVVPADFLTVSLPSAFGVWNGTRSTEVALQTTYQKVYVSKVKFPMLYDDPDSPTQQHSVTWPPSVTRVVSTPSIFNASGTCDCTGHGQCQHQGRVTSCLCQNGWSGNTCQVPPDSCFRHLCQNGATCLPDVSAAGRNYTCQCAVGFTGPNCTDQIVNGGWAEWSAWNNCSATCRSQQQRRRRCANPTPLNGGSNCVGVPDQSRDCGLASCQISGNWSSWTSWSPCSTTCWAGETTRTRQCEAPPGITVQQGDVTVCKGEDSQTQVCIASSLPCPVHGSWSTWSAWSRCSVTCGSGTQSRVRSCDNPLPDHGGDNCTGADTEWKSCPSSDCPSCPTLQPVPNGTWSCNNSLSSGLRRCTLVCVPPYVSNGQVPPFLCGPETGYLWNHQQNSSGPSGKLPSCTRPEPMSLAYYKQTVKMNTACDNGETVSAARQTLTSTVPCLQQSVCSLNVTSSCTASASSGRKKRATPTSLSLTITISADLSSYQNLDTAASWTQYNNVVNLLNQSLAMVDNWVSLLSLTVNGQPITPDVTSFSASMNVQCPLGKVFRDGLCADCPLGSVASDGACVVCPIGQYQDQVSATSCKTCPAGFTTELAGATDVSLCYVPLQLSSVQAEGKLDAGIIVAIVLSVVAVVIASVALAIVVYKKGLPPRIFKRGSVSVAPPVELVEPTAPRPSTGWQSMSRLAKEDTALSMGCIDVNPAITPPPPYSTHLPETRTDKQQQVDYHSVQTDSVDASHEPSGLTILDEKS